MPFTNLKQLRSIKAWLEDIIGQIKEKIPPKNLRRTEVGHMIVDSWPIIKNEKVPEIVFQFSQE